MDELRDGIWTVGYGEKNPLVEYKIEGFHFFKTMLTAMKEEIMEFMMKVQVEHVIEDQFAEYQEIGDEFHAEVGQFGSGGIPTSAVPVKKRENARTRVNQNVQQGGVKRKKTRRNKRG